MMKTKFFRFLLFVLLLSVSFARGSEDDDEFIPEAAATSTSVPPKRLVEFDDDEFVGVEEAKQKEQQEAVLKNLAAQTKQVGSIPEFAPPRSDYWVEIGYSIVIILYLLNFFIGKRSNETVAKAWAAESISVARSQFSRVGDMHTGEVGIVKETQNTFHLNAAGRVHCTGLQATLKLRKRHDLLSILQEFIFPADDEVVLTFALHDDEVDPFVFALVRKKDEKNYRKNNVDMAFTSAATSVPGLPATLVACSEHEDLLNDLLLQHQEIVNVLSKYENLVVSVHISDQGLVSEKHKKTVRFVFRLPKLSEMSQITTLTKMALYFIDVVAQTKLSKQAHAKSEKHRSHLAQAALKEQREKLEEAARDRKAAKTKKEKEMVDRMSPEEQRRWEEKQYRREMKKKQGGKVKMMVVG